MKSWILTLGVVSLLSLTACVSTPKQPPRFDQLGQFSAIPLNAQSYRISFAANHRIHPNHAEEITLLKAAQTTIQQGFQFFQVLDDPSNRASQAPRQAVVYSAPHPMAYGYYRRHPVFWPDPFFDLPYTVDLQPSQVSYTIQCFKIDKAPADAFDARLILQSLGQKYGLTATGQILSTDSQ